MKTIFVNGTFDVIHIGHLRLLAYARSLGDRLIVGIDSDERVRSLKGDSRPINSQHERAELLLALKFVDDVCIFNTDEELITLIKKCNLMVKGSDYRGQPIIGEHLCEVIFYDRIEPYSSTKKIEDIRCR